MSESVSTPRVTAPYLDSHVGRNVVLVGKVVQLRGDSAVIDSDGNVTAILNRVSSRLIITPAGLIPFPCPRTWWPPC